MPQVLAEFAFNIFAAAYAFVAMRQIVFHVAPDSRLSAWLDADDVDLQLFLDRHIPAEADPRG